MKVSYKWLRDVVPFEVSAEQLADDLTMLGLEVEGLEPWGEDDHILDIQITPNRGDCVSILGIAREISVHYGLPMEYPRLLQMPKGASPKVTVEDYDLCPRYTGIVLEVEKLEPSPMWMQMRLEACGLRPINNIVDITNYVLVEMGQPLHAFDMDMLAGGEIIVRRAEEGERILLIEERELSLCVDDLVIADREKPVALAGVMGGRESEISEKTRRMLLESASFNPASVRRTSRRYGVVSDSSYRFERGVGYNSAMDGSLRACWLFQESGSAKVVGGYADLGEAPASRSVSVDPAGVQDFLGMELNWDEVISKLAGIGIPLLSRKGDALTFEVPDFRPDLKDEADLAEEVARLVGYDKIPESFPSGTFRAPKHAPMYIFQRCLRDALTSAGLFETATLSFTNRRELDRCGYKLPEGESLIYVENPLSEEFTVMRPTMVPSMLAVLRHNVNRKVEDLALFEIGNTYTMKGEELVERTKLIITLTGRIVPCHWSFPQGFLGDTYDLSGIIEFLASELNLSKDITFEGKGDSCCRAESATGLYIAGKRFGFMGQVASDVARAYDLENPVFLTELEIIPLMDCAREVRIYQPVPQYPAVERDLALLVDEGVSAGEILAFARKEGGELLREVRLFDLFTGKKVGKGKKSLGINFLYQSEERTLTDEEVNELHRKLVDKLVSKFKGRVR